MLYTKLFVFIMFTTPFITFVSNNKALKAQVDLGVCGSGKYERMFIPDSWGGANFSSACKKHDSCYDILGSSKSSCDDEFRANLRQECKNTYTSWAHQAQKRSCLEAANTYYEAVKRMGGDAFREAQRDAARDKSVISNNLVFFKTRREHFINAYDSIGNVSAQPTGNTVDVDRSDELFRLIDVNGGSLNDGDKICLKTRRDHTLNAHDSAGNVSAIPTGNCTDTNVSDEIFAIYKVNGSGTINSGDKICLKTRRDHTLNAHDSAGNVSAIPTGNCTNEDASDEIFTIYFL